MCVCTWVWGSACNGIMVTKSCLHSHICLTNADQRHFKNDRMDTLGEQRKVRLRPRFRCSFSSDKTDLSELLSLISHLAHSQWQTKYHCTHLLSRFCAMYFGRHNFWHWRTYCWVNVLHVLELMRTSQNLKNDLSLLTILVGVFIWNSKLQHMIFGKRWIWKWKWFATV